MLGSQRFARSGPVHFQSLESELAPIKRHLRGHLLNAGCGNRDLAPWLELCGVSNISNYDLASDLPKAIIGSLDHLPFADRQFDTILCNAVLEHVERPAQIVAEFSRVLKPGGHLILAVPFLQPYHQCPNDFRRYTVEGLAALGEDAGLTCIATNPVHSMAQTIGWILWEIAKEKGPLMRAWVWPFVFAWTRLSTRTDPTVIRNANTFQMVFAQR